MQRFVVISILVSFAYVLVESWGFANVFLFLTFRLPRMAISTSWSQMSSLRKGDSMWGAKSRLSLVEFLQKLKQKPNKQKRP